MNTRRSLDGFALGAMIIVCAVLGVQQVALKSVEADISPVLQLAIRSGIAAVLVAIWMRLRQESFSLSDGTLKPGLLLGLLFALEYVFLGEGLRYTSASRMVIFLYSAPLFSAIVLHMLKEEERLKPVQWLGIFLAFLGVALAFYVDESTEQPLENQLLGDIYGLLAGVAWGLSTVVIRVTQLSSAPASKTLLYQLVVAFCLLFAVAIVLGQMHINVTPVVVGNLLFQGVIVSFATFLAWLSLLRRYVASQLGVLMFMTPVFGVALGVVLLDEPLHGRFLVGACMVIGGILLVSAEPLFARHSSVSRTKGYSA